MLKATLVPRRRRQFLVENLEPRSLLASVSGAVFNDANGSGVQDAGESPLSGFTVLLDTDQDSVADPGELTAVTGVDGSYMFALPAATSPVHHYLEAILPPGDAGGRWLNTTNNYERVIIDPAVNPDPALTLNFGFRFVPYSTFAPQGGETLVNVTTAGQQGVSKADGYLDHGRSIATDGAGNFVVTWANPGANGQQQIFARVFNADGSARTGEVKVAEGTTNGITVMPLVAMSRDGSRFVVTWSNYKPSKSGSPFSEPGTWAPFAQAYDANSGAKVGSQLQVAAFSTKQSFRAAGVGLDSDGDFTVMMYDQPRGVGQVQRYSRQAVAIGKPVDVIGANLQNGGQSMSMAADGSFVVVWTNLEAIYAQRFSATASKIGGQITVANAAPGAAGMTHYPNVAMNDSKRFAVTWQANDSNYVQAYDAAGVPSGASLSIGNGLGAVAVAMDASGNVTLANGVRAVHPNWITAAFENATEIRVRRLSAAGVLSETQVVNTTTQGSQDLASVAATSNGFVVSWTGRGVSDDQGVFCQRFTTDVPPPSTTTSAASDAAMLEYLLAVNDDDERT